MKQPQIVIGVTGGIAECMHNEKDVDYLIIDFLALDEFGEPEERDHVETLIGEGKFNEASEFIADVEERLEQRMMEEG